MRSLGDSATKGSSLVKAEKEAWTISEVISNAPKAKQKKKKRKVFSPKSSQSTVIAISYSGEQIQLAKLNLLGMWSNRLSRVAD